MNGKMASPTLSFKYGFLSVIDGINLEVTPKYWAAIGLEACMAGAPIGACGGIIGGIGA